MLSIVYFRIAHSRTVWNASMLSISKVRNINFRKYLNIDYANFTVYRRMSITHCFGFKGTLRPFESGGLIGLVQSGIKYWMPGKLFFHNFNDTVSLEEHKTSLRVPALQTVFHLCIPKKDL
jgi:hypothetical protein